MRSEEPPTRPRSPRRTAGRCSSRRRSSRASQARSTTRSTGPGRRTGYSYELTRLTGDRTYVRYLPTGVRAGDPRASYLVVGTYAQPGSFANLKRASKQKGSVSLGIPGDGLAVFSPARPTSVYFGYPGKGYQVEVYSPSGQNARSLVLGGKITPVG